jgi:transaldolase/glucose-6-phosphate isomerase
MPEVTIEAFAQDGILRPDTVEEGVDEARDVFEALGALGVDFGAVTEQLVNEGAQKFLDPYDQLMAGLASRRGEGLGAAAPTQRTPDVPGLEATLDALNEQCFARRLFEGDAGLWSSDPATMRSISNRLGWVRGAEAAGDDIYEIERFAEEIRREGFLHVVVLGMGGSSLCPLVVAQTFGRREGWPELLVLDQTDPEAVREADARIDLAATLFLVASKSGSTVETLSLYRYFDDRVARSGDGSPGGRFVALTDPGSPLLALAQERGFRRTFETPADVGGRYSALTHYGLVPMALAGVDVEAVLRSARAMRQQSSAAIRERHNPAIRLGAVLARHALAGRDKVTISADGSIGTFPLWIEQLVAESTGKDGVGLVPVVNEPPHRPAEYGNDRIFVHITLAGDEGSNDRMAALAGAGHPVVEIEIPTHESLGGEFLRWEIATATAGALLGVNPFDQPNVAESKRNTADLLERWTLGSGFAEDTPVVADGGIEVHVDRARSWAAKIDVGSLPDVLGGLAGMAREGNYLAVLGYFAATPGRDRIVEELRAGLLQRTGAATTFGYGPRYLHSTGQLHKGGPDAGVFLLLTADPVQETPIPEEDYGFGTLQRAQALGDYEALLGRGLRVVRVNLGGRRCR